MLRDGLVDVVVEVDQGYDGVERPGELACEQGGEGFLSKSAKRHDSEQYAAPSICTCLSQARQKEWVQRSNAIATVVVV